MSTHSIINLLFVQSSIFLTIIAVAPKAQRPPAALIPLRPPPSRARAHRPRSPSTPSRRRAATAARRTAMVAHRTATAATRTATAALRTALGPTLTPGLLPLSRPPRATAPATTTGVGEDPTTTAVFSVSLPFKYFIMRSTNYFPQNALLNTALPPPPTLPLLPPALTARAVPRPTPSSSRLLRVSRGLFPP